MELLNKASSSNQIGDNLLQGNITSSQVSLISTADNDRFKKKPMLLVPTSPFNIVKPITPETMLGVPIDDILGPKKRRTKAGAYLFQKNTVDTNNKRYEKAKIILIY